MMWGNDYMSGWGFGHGIGGILMMVVFWALIIAVFVMLYHQFRKGGGGGFPCSRETPLDILKKRYAGGEISKDDFERMKKDLSS